MFFVSLLLNQMLGWMRAQPGTTSLRAILYMDEIFGYFPPVANPPSKLPLLTLLKQARAFGVGHGAGDPEPGRSRLQGAANTGTWFIGRLQTERDKARVLDGLEGAAATSGTGFDRSQIETILSGLGNRVFLMNNTHEDAAGCHADALGDELPARAADPGADPAADGAGQGSHGGAGCSRPCCTADPPIGNRRPAPLHRRLRPRPPR